MRILNTTKNGLPVWLKLLLILALLMPLVASPLGSTPAFAQAVPPACVDDAGNAQAPQQVGAWVLVLNFNHPQSATHTRGCLVGRTGPGPNQLSYTQILCPIVNNNIGATVGAGRADFNGQFWIECSGLPPVPTTPPGGSLYEYFYVYGRAAFPFTGGQHTLLAHSSVDVTAEVDANWHVKLTSRYNTTTFSNTDKSTNVAGTFPRLHSQVFAKEAYHYVNMQQLQPGAQIPPFTFNSQKIRVGNQGEYWSLFELVIDPGPRPQCCFNP